MEVKTEIAVQDSQHWSHNAKHYTTTAFKPIVYYFSDVAAKILLDRDESKLVNGGTFLDVCAGPAVFSIAVMNKFGLDILTSTNFIISDFSTGMVEAAKEAVEVAAPSRPNTQFLVIDVQNIELPSDSADVVGCMFGYFVPDRVKAFSEVCRVCKPGGIAVVGTWKYPGLAYVFADFLTFLGEAYDPALLNVAQVYADGDVLRTELIGFGFSQVVIHEHSHVFEIPLAGEAMDALFANPMIKPQLASFSHEFVQSEWAKFVRQPDFKYELDLQKNVLLVRYTGNIAIATK